jgi:hypothetical protein
VSSTEYLPPMAMTDPNKEWRKRNLKEMQSTPSKSFEYIKKYELKRCHEKLKEVLYTREI